MALYFFSLDYLIASVQQLHKEGFATKSSFTSGTAAHQIVSRAIATGLVKKCTCQKMRRLYYQGKGRVPNLYQLNRDYEAIRIRDLVPLLTKISYHEAQVYRLIWDMPIEMISRITPPVITLQKTFSGDKFLGILSCMSHCDYTQCDDMLHVTSQSSHRRMMLSALVKKGIIDVSRGEGYKLKKPLTKMKIELLLPLLWSTSKRKQTYNRAIYHLRHRPVSCLIRTHNVL